MSKLQWNQKTGCYEYSDGEVELVVSGDEMSEAKDTMAQERFGVNYEDTTDAQSDLIDEEIESTVGWANYNIRESAK